MKVAIIGAGVAGLTAARELAERGAQVQVFEKSRGVGGRLANKRLDWGNMDIGAQYFTARDSRFKNQVERWQNDGFVDRWQLKPHSVSSSGLTTRPDPTVRYVGVPTMTTITHVLAKGIDITFNTRIDEIECQNHVWTLKTAEGLCLKERYDWVVLSVPLEQSKALLRGTAIEDKLPELTHEPCWALGLATIGDVAAEVQGIFGDETVSWVSRLSSRPQRVTSKNHDDLWMLHFSSEWSLKHSKDTHIDIAQVGVEWLSQTLEDHISTPLQAAQSYHHFWRYARVKSFETTPGIIADHPTGIATIGAWTSGGRVEGAYLSALEFIDEYFS